MPALYVVLVFLLLGSSVAVSAGQRVPTPRVMEAHGC